MRALVVRHYKTLINASGRIMGWGDSPRAQDWETDLRCVDEILNQQGVKFDAVYSSYLERARQTAMYFARKRGLPVIRDTQELNEVNYGTLFRQPKNFVKKNIPEYKTDPDYVFPGGESFRQMQQRSVRFMLSLAERRPSDTVLVVVHAGVIRGLICALLGLDFASNLKQKISHQYIGDFELRDGQCIRYDEHGTLSGFINQGEISLPHLAPAERHPSHDSANKDLLKHFDIGSRPNSHPDADKASGSKS